VACDFIFLYISFKIALPGGKVAFWEGIMTVAQDDNGIAVIMGHEVAHALARHGAERMSQAIGAQTIGERMSKASGGGKPPEFLSTHPSDESRIAQIKQWLPEAMKYYKGPAQ